MNNTRFAQVNRAREALAEQRRWIESCGGTRSGYILRYGRASDPDHLGDGGEAIYEADMAELAQRQATYDRLRG